MGHVRAGSFTIRSPPCVPSCLWKCRRVHTKQMITLIHFWHLLLYCTLQFWYLIISCIVNTRIAQWSQISYDRLIYLFSASSITTIIIYALFYIIHGHIETRSSGKNAYVSLIRHGHHIKRCLQQFFYFCVCIRCRGKVITKPLPSNDRRYTYRHTDWW
jgi:hypothetical protein